jgi:hypothetical protein
MIIQTVILIVIGVAISLSAFMIVVKLFASQPVDTKTIIIAGSLMMGLSYLLGFIPLIGWFLALIINMFIIQQVMECSPMQAILAMMLWGGSVGLFFFFADQLNLMDYFPLV